VTMNLDPVPASAYYLDLVRIDGGRGCDEPCLDMNARDEAVGRQLVMRRVAGSSHEKFLPILRKYDGRDC
jgi:hypothetical protein